VSKKIAVLKLDGKTLHRSRCRAQRLVDAGDHIWIGPRTVRQVVPPKQAAAFVDRIVERTAPRFDPNYFYPSTEAHPELRDLPFAYPLPFEILRHYQSSRAAIA
jgi:hypothetical protein